MPPVTNPLNPLVPTHCTADGPPPPARLRVREELAHSILTHNDSPDIPYDWSVNPYRGCLHGCAYCYARHTHEYLGLGAGTDFDTQLFVKINAPELLDAALARPGWRREFIAFSGVTDCYQAIEADYRLTRRCLEVCLRHNNPVGITTKSDLVTRDADLLAEFNRRHATTVFFSIPHADAAVAARLEPAAPPPERRFAAMRALHTAGVPVGLLLAPIIPGLNDRDIPALLARAADCGAAEIGYTPVRLPGRVADVFLMRLRQELPEAATRVEARIRELRDGRLNSPAFGCRMEGHGAYWESVQRLVETMATRHGLNAGQPWRDPAPACAAPQPRQMTLF